MTGFGIQVPAKGLSFTYTLGEKDKAISKLKEMCSIYGEDKVYFAAFFDKLR